MALVAACLAAMVCFGIAHPPQSPQLFFWTQPVVIEFVVGMAIALMLRYGLSLAAPLRYTLIGLGAAAFFLYRL